VRPSLLSTDNCRSGIDDDPSPNEKVIFLECFDAVESTSRYWREPKQLELVAGTEMAGTRKAQQKWLQYIMIRPHCFRKVELSEIVEEQDSGYSWPCRTLGPQIMTRKCGAISLELQARDSLQDY
jgi:hypothetical protein